MINLYNEKTVGENTFNLPKTKNTDIEFVAIPSGDHEAFCWDVDRETFIKIKGNEPEEDFDNSYFNKGLFRIYPDDFYGFDKPKCKIKLLIEVL